MAKFEKHDKIDGYEVLFFIKLGKYAETYRVKNKNGKQRFLKLINPSKLESYQIDKNGNIIEIEVSKHLHHNNICEYVSDGNIIKNGQKLYYITYNYISGETVSQKCIREQKCSVYDAKHIAIGVLNALDYLHNLYEPIIHNEITSLNTMVDMVSEEETPKLIDFGASQFLKETTQIPIIEGLNPFYLAPERFKGVCSTKTDLYSVGVLLYHLIFGQTPWLTDLSRIEEKDRIETIIKKKREPLKILDTDIFELDEQLINTIEKATCFDEEKRFQTAKEFIQALNGEIKISGGNNCDMQSLHKIEKKGNGFSDIAGMNDLKTQIKEDLIDMLQNPEPYKEMGLNLPNGILFYGPPGCGKTFFAEKLAEEVGSNYMYISCSDVASPYIHGGQTKIAEIFSDAQKNAPSILFLDEIDALLTDRKEQHNVSESGEVNEFLTQMNNCGERGIFVIGATNQPEKIDKAALRGGRLEKQYYIANPDFESRCSLFELYLKNRSELGIDYKALAKSTDGLVSVDIKLITDVAARKAIHMNKKKITETILEDVIASFQPTVSKAEIKRYENLRDLMRGNNKTNMPHIGY